MIDPELLRLIRSEITKTMNVILSGSSGENTVEKENIEEMYPGYPTIQTRPVMHPAGFASRANKGTIQVTARHGDHPGNRIVLGHRDKLRPDTLEEGEAVMYSDETQLFALKNGKAQIKNDTFELITELSKMVQTMMDATTLTLLGPQKWDPITQLKLLELKQKIDTMKKED